MQKPVLTISELRANVEDKEILKGVNLEIKGGEVHAIMGPNGTGKSTLSSTIMGHPKYHVTSGNVTLNNEDVFRFQVREVENNKKIEYLECEFENENGKDAFKIISSFHFVEPAWCYAYKKDFYVKNKFVFKENCYHEDYGLIPYIILLANNVSCYNFIGYNYIIRNNSIMTTNDYNKTRKKAFDVLFQYKNLLDITKKINNKEYFLSYITNSAILKANTLNLKDKKRYIKELKKLRVYNYILDDSLARKIKKMILKININLYIKIFKA